jgi:hypothetical protein
MSVCVTPNGDRKFEAVDEEVVGQNERYERSQRSLTRSNYDECAGGGGQGDAHLSKISCIAYALLRSGPSKYTCKSAHTFVNKRVIASQAFRVTRGISARKS